MKVVYLNPLSSFVNSMPSDSLFGSLMWAISCIYGQEKVTDLLHAYQEGQIPFLISSCFPFFYKKKELTSKAELWHFLPKPMLPSSKHDKEQKQSTKEVKKVKRFKKLKYLEAKSFNKLINKQTTLQEIMKDENLWNDWSIAHLETTEVLQNSIDRLTSSTSVKDESGNKIDIGGLYFSRQYFMQNGGLFFLIKGNPLNKDIWDMVEGGLAFLSHKGLGGDASTGKGHFSITVKDCDFLSPPKSANHFVNLSLYSPENDEALFYQSNNEMLAYDLVYRKGIIGGAFLKPNNIWKKPLIMFGEGSLFPYPKKQNQIGKNVVVYQKNQEVPFDIYNYGMAFDLPVMV